jgi:hypothetical protein
MKNVRMQSAEYLGLASILNSSLSILNLVEPEVVATSPYRIKSPVPVYCGIGSIKMGGLTTWRLGRTRLIEREFATT